MAKKPPPEKMPWSPGGKRLARALHGCSMLPGSWDKRFARNMAEIATADDNEPGKYGITLAQKEQLIRLAQKYRRQIPDWGEMILTTTAPQSRAEIAMDIVRGWQRRILEEFKGQAFTPETMSRMRARLAELAAEQSIVVNAEITQPDPKDPQNIRIQGMHT